MIHENLLEYLAPFVHNSIWNGAERSYVISIFKNTILFTIFILYLLSL